MRPTTRTEVLSRLRKTIDNGSIIVGSGAGTSLPARPQTQTQTNTLTTNQPRNRALRQSRRKRRRGPNPHLQLGQVPHGGPGLVSGPDAVFRCKPGRS